MPTLPGYTGKSDGDVFYASLLNGIMGQSNMVFASTSARDTALSGELAQGMFAVTTDTDSLWYYDGSGWVAWSTPWTSFTPSWGNLTEGNGTNSGRYRYQNGDLLVRARIDLGSTSSVTGSVTLTLPNSEVAAGLLSLGTTVSKQSGTGTYDGVAMIESNTSTIDCYSDNAINATVPFTWGTGDRLGVQILVEIA